MNVKSETYYHLAVLAHLGINSIATPDNNLKIRTLLSKCNNPSFEEIYSTLPKKTSENLEYKLQKVRDLIDATSTSYGMLVYGQSNFPKELEDPTTTPVLYYRGNPELLKKERITIVGTRQELNPEESAQAKKILNHIQSKNYVIVSGLAYGCDSLAHTAGLVNGTIGIIADPVNDYYLQRNKELAETIAVEHLLVSQFPIGIKDFFHPRYYHGITLPRRNQTTVALSTKGVVVLKTLDKGGTQHAIRFSQELEKPLYALECNFTKENTWPSRFEWVKYSLCRGIKKETQMNFENLK